MHNCSTLKMLNRVRHLRPIEICLNAVFAVWVLYFIVTGYIIPKPLVRHAVRPPVPVIEQQQQEPLPEYAPLIEADQDS